jgi:hypothetical protein
MQVKEITDAEKAKYNELAFRYGTIYNVVDWLGVFGDRVRLIGIYDEGNNLKGGFTLYEEKKFGFRILRNPPYTPNVGPFLEVEAKNHIAIMETWKKALDSMADFLDNSSASIISITLSKNIIDTQPFIWKKFKVVARYKYLLCLKSSIDDIWSGMSKVRRNEIKKAENDGLIVRKVHDLEIVRKLFIKTLSRQEKSVDDNYLENILFNFANDNNSFAFAVFKEEKPIASFFAVYDKIYGHGVVSGYDQEQKHRGAGPLAAWAAIKYAKDLGMQYFDFEGSMIPRFEKYLRDFGGDLVPYYGINKAKLPLEILLKFFKRELF